MAGDRLRRGRRDLGSRVDADHDVIGVAGLDVVEDVKVVVLGDVQDVGRVRPTQEVSGVGEDLEPGRRGARQEGGVPEVRGGGRAHDGEEANFVG